MDIKIPNLILPGEEEVKEAKEEVMEAADNAAQAVADKAQEATDAAVSAVESVSDNVSAVADRIAESVQSVAAAVQEAPEAAAQKMEAVSEEDDSLNFNNLSPEEQAAVLAFVDRIDIHDSETVLKYGNAAQVKISQFADQILEDVKTKDTGAVSDMLANLVAELKGFDVDEGKKGGLLSAKIKWNFTKFLVDRNGNVVERFASTVTPDKMEEKIKELI